MKDYYEDLMKIADLLRSDQEANVMLGLSLCLGMAPYCIDTWELIFQEIGMRYWQWDGERKNKEKLLELEGQIAQLIYQQLPAFQAEERGYWISDFVGRYLNMPRSSTVLLELEAYLKKELNAHDWAVMLMASRVEQKIATGVAIGQVLPIEEICQKEFKFFDVWLMAYKAWRSYNINHNIKAGARRYQREGLAAFSEGILVLVERYYQQKRIKEDGPYILFELLSHLWEDASLFDADQQINTNIQARIIAIISQPVFPEERQQSILLCHPLFKFVENPMQRIGGMGADCEVNLYNCPVKRVQGYLDNFSRYHHHLKTERWKEAQKEIYRKAIHEIWSYYYLTDLESYLNVILSWDPVDADSYFYLGQLYFGFKEEEEKALLYFKKFLALAPQRIPDNNFFITEMDYAHRCYAPSILEALTWIGELFEAKGKVEEALESYEKAIRLAPNHHQAPYLSLFKLGKKLKQPRNKLLDLLDEYSVIFYTQTTWEDKQAYAYNYAVELGANRKAWTDRYEYLMVPDVDLGRAFGYPDLKWAMVYQFYTEAEYLYYEEEKALEAVVFCMHAKRLLEDDFGLRTVVYKKEKKYPLPTKPITIEDVLYLQAELMVELYKDYWQAQSIYKKILKQNPKHHLAKKALKNVQYKIGY